MLRCVFAASDSSRFAAKLAAKHAQLAIHPRCVVFWEINMEITITKENFDTEVIHSALPVLLDFWATWCGPCRMLSPVIAEIAEEYDGKVKVGKVNVDEEEELAAAFQVESIPMVVLIKDGKAVDGFVGYRPKADIVKLLEK